MKVKIIIADRVSQGDVMNKLAFSGEGNCYEVDTTNAINLYPHEIIRYKLETEEQIVSLESNKIQKKAEVKAPQTFKLTITGRMIPITEDQVKYVEETEDGLKVMPPLKKGSLNGRIGTSSDSSKNSLEETGRYMLKNSKKILPAVEREASGFGGSDEDQLHVLDAAESIENINRIKNWAVSYKYSKGNGGSKGISDHMKDSADYRDVMLEVYINEDQSLYYHLPNMYVDKYIEEFDIAKGEGTYIVILKAQNESEDDLTFKTSKGAKFDDKVSKGVLKTKLQIQEMSNNIVSKFKN